MLYEAKRKVFWTRVRIPPPPPKDIMKTRKLQSGEEVIELDAAKTLTVYTKCPEKWLLTDMETGEQYVGFTTDGSLSWKKVSFGGGVPVSTGQRVTEWTARQE